MEQESKWYREHMAFIKVHKVGECDGVTRAMSSAFGTVVGAEAAATGVSSGKEEVVEAGAAVLPCASLWQAAQR